MIRQDEFVWLDLVRQFRNPEKQQIIPVNLTKEIIDETSILYREEPIYQVVDKNKKILKKDQELWDEIKRDCRYTMFMDRVDRWTRLLGTVLVKVSFIDPHTGFLVEKNEGGKVQLDILHGGTYDVRYGSSPYYISELLIGFGNKFGGFSGYGSASPSNVIGPHGVTFTTSDGSSYGNQSAEVRNVNKRTDYNSLGTVNRIYWSVDNHRQIDTEGKMYEVQNPYGIIPAVPFFNADPAHYYFLPINEPLIYANHTVNMRLTDLNHIAKFQSFGVPVVTGVERPTSIRQGRPVDDFNMLKGGFGQSRFGGISGMGGFGAGGQYRTFDSGMSILRDGNADANALGFSIGPDTAITLGEKGDFKFAHPSADINGLTNAIHSIIDIVRMNHGLRPKFQEQLPASGFAIWLEKMGVIDENQRRQKLFREREQQLFKCIKTLWNTHYNKSGDRKFSDEAQLDVTYVDAKFPVEPKTNLEAILMEQKIVASGDKQAYKRLYPYLSDGEINKVFKDYRKDMEEQKLAEAEIRIEVANKLKEAGLPETQQKSGSSFAEKKDPEIAEAKIDNRAKHSQESSKQLKKESE